MSDANIDPEGNYDNTQDFVKPQITTAPNQNLEEEFGNDYNDKDGGEDEENVASHSNKPVSIERENNSSILPEIQLGGSIQNRNLDNNMVNMSSISKISKKSSVRSGKIKLKESLNQDQNDQNQSLDGSKQGLLRGEEEYGNGMREISQSANPTVTGARLTLDEANAGKNSKIVPYQSIDSQGSLNEMQNDVVNRSSQKSLGESQLDSSNASQARRQRFARQQGQNNTLNAIALDDAITKSKKIGPKTIKSRVLTFQQQLPAIRKKLGAAVDHNYSQGIMTLITIYALIASDVKVIGFDVDADPAFVVITCISMFMFLAELILSSIGKEGYWLSFFFWLDLIATFSLVTDIDPLVEAVSGDSSGNSGAGDTATLARASRGARIGTRAGRMTRVIRLIRLIRIVKLYKSANQAVENRDNDKSGGGQSELQKLQEAKLASQKTKKMDQESSEEEVQEVGIVSALASDQMESRVGKKLSEITTKKVIILVLVMLFSSMLFKSGSYLDEPDSFDYGLMLIQNLGISTTGGKRSYLSFIEAQKQLEFTPLVFISIVDESGTTLEWSAENYNIDSYRKNEKKIESLQVLFKDGTSQEQRYLAIYDLKKQMKLEAILSLATTFLVCSMLTAGAALFSKMTTDLVITPIEDMIMRVNNITADPLGAAHQEEERLLFEELAEKEKAHKSMENYDQKLMEKKKQKEDKNEPMETAMLESTLSKIGALLALGFGEAGSEIIAKNMAQGGEVNPMLPGIKLMSIFGFCDIRNFTDATEVLQEGVMLFVNEIGEIIHGIVDRYSGAANKNIGDAFLLVWKFEPDMQTIDKQTGELYAKECSKVAQLADMSVVSFLLCIAELRKSHKMVKYNTHKGLNERLGDGFQVRLGMGLHLGYAIEGAIGSYYKIDASYLSPHVKMPERLESSTKAFGVPLLISGSLYKALTRATRKYCRQVDYVTMVGSNEPVRLFTVDIDTSQLKVELKERHMTGKERKIKRVHERIKRDNLREAAFKCQIQVSDKFDQDKDIMAMRKPFKQEFFTTYNKAFKAYQKGLWEAAKIGFVESLRLCPKCNDMGYVMKEDIINTKLVSFSIDPNTTVQMEKLILVNAQESGVLEPVTERLLQFMAETNYQAPSDWKGYKFFSE